MDPGKPIIGQDAVIFLDVDSHQKLEQFRWFNHDIFTEVDVFLVRNNKSKTLVTADTNAVLELDVNGQQIFPSPTGRFTAIRNTIYTVRYYFTKEAHVDPYHNKFPVFKFRIEMVGNPNVFAESNEFKVVF